MNDLKKAADPFVQLKKEIEELKDRQEVANEWLSLLCKLKQKQQREDDKFRYLWRKSKINTSLIFVAVSGAVYFDVLKVESQIILDAISFLF